MGCIFGTQKDKKRSKADEDHDLFIDMCTNPRKYQQAPDGYAIVEWYIRVIIAILQNNPVAVLTTLVNAPPINPILKIPKNG